MSFSSILVPVDLSINTELAVKKALELSSYGTTIHLLHIQSLSVPGFSELTKKYRLTEYYSPGNEEIDTCLGQWKQSIEEFGNNIKVCTWIIMNDSVQNAIQAKAVQLGVNLIIIGKNSHHFRLPFLNTVIPSKIVRKTGVPVLTVKPGSFHNKTRTVVLPVSTAMAQEKMDIISMISKKIKIRVYLVTFLDDNINHPGANASALLQAYKWLKTSINCPVDYAVLQGRNKAKSILSYTEKINADFLLLYPGTETKIGWMNRHISDILPPSTKVEIFTVQQLTNPVI